MKKKLTKDYVAGFIDCSGGFYLFKNTQRRKAYPIFKLVCHKQDKQKLEVIEKVRDYFLKNYKVHITMYEAKDSFVYQLTNMSSIEKFIEFIEQNCFLTKTHQKRIKGFIKRKKEIKKQMEQHRKELKNAK
jgi:hypothetical protein